LIAFAGVILAFRIAPGMRERTLFRITLEILVMVAFLTAVLSQAGGEVSPLLNLYLLPIIAAALALGKRATVLVVVLVCVCYFLLAVLRGGVGILTPALATQATGILAPFLLVAFLTSMLAENILTAKRRIRSLSDRDELTKIYNIGAFMRLAQSEHSRAIRVERAYSILMIDVDGLKRINDTLGHEAGNRALMLVADALTRITRTEDVAARYGGDEFILLLPGIERDGAEELAQRIRNVVFSSTLEVGPKMVRVNVSVGCASFPTDGADIEALMQAADRAMYRDKDMRKKPEDTLVLQKI
ncbi:MAG TPA: GGDEF domain-containing protein, partial [Gammaproteobacteria bacterium]